jgi:hypothetical protein
LTGTGRFPELIYVNRSNSEEEEPERVENGGAWETVYPYPSPAAEEDMGMFRPGEVTSDYRAVVEAIGSGRRAANSIHRYLTGLNVEAPDAMIRKQTTVLNVKELEPISKAPRQRMPELPQEERISNPSAEIALGYSEEQARSEARRCLQCGLICYRRLEGGLH